MNKIEKLVRFYAKKILKEAFSDFDRIVEESVEKKLDMLMERKQITEQSRDNSLYGVFGESLQRHGASKKAGGDNKTKEEGVDRAAVRERMLKAVGASDDVWRGIYEDTIESGNPLLTSSEEEGEGELVSEHLLQESGLMRDYSKHINAFEETSQPAAGFDANNLGGSSGEEMDEFKKTLSKVYGQER